MIGIPRVSAVMVTANRAKYVPRAIRYFQAQTYANKELVIVDSEDGSLTRSLISDERNIRYFQTRRPMELGALRNLGADLSNGDLIAHWDDDDYSSPGRLASQVETMRESGAAVSGYHSILFWDEKLECVWQFETNEPTRALGTSLIYKRAWWRENQFTDLKHESEDTGFILRAAVAGVLASVHGFEPHFQMVARMHDQNTNTYLHNVLRNSRPDDLRISKEWKKNTDPDLVDEVRSLLA